MPQSNAKVEDRDRVLQVLSLEYQTLREDILVRATGRFQFLGLMTTAAALLASGILGHSIFGRQIWISATLASLVLLFGFVCYLILGGQMIMLSARVAEIEKRINALVPAEPALLSWESSHQEGSTSQRMASVLLKARVGLIGPRRHIRASEQGPAASIPPDSFRYPR